MDASVEPSSGPALLNNAQKITQVRHFAALAGGAAAGALRLESLHGFALYGVTVVITTLLMTWILATPGPQHYFDKPAKHLLVGGVMEALPGYLLAWVLVYGLIEI